MFLVSLLSHVGRPDYGWTPHQTFPPVIKPDDEPAAAGSVDWPGPLGVIWPPLEGDTGVVRPTGSANEVVLLKRLRQGPCHIGSAGLRPGSQEMGAKFAPTTLSALRLGNRFRAWPPMKHSNQIVRYPERFSKVWVERPTWPFSAATCRRASAPPIEESNGSSVARQTRRAGSPPQRASGPFHPPLD
jgi:hypothetical protein